VSNFNINVLKNALENMPFHENELAYLSISGQSEDTFRDRLGYYLANQNHNGGYTRWTSFFPKEAVLKSKPIDLALLTGKGNIEDRVEVIMEFKHLFMTQILYGDELNGKKESSGVKVRILKDILSRLKIVKEIQERKNRKIQQYQVLFISHYIADKNYEKLIDRQEIYTHNIAKYLHVPGKRKELGLIRKSLELENENSPFTDERGIYHEDGLIPKIKEKINEVFNNHEEFNVNVECGRLDKNRLHKYHYFIAKPFFIIMEITPK
jgi:hypothetical protein